MSETLEILKREIVESLIRDFINEPCIDEYVLTDKVNDAVRDVRMRRNYSASSYTEEKISEDLQNYYTVIKNLAAYDYAKRGADFESSHSEGDVSRHWEERDDILRSVHAFVGIL